jgi:hypothetical protein
MSEYTQASGTTLDVSDSVEYEQVTGTTLDVELVVAPGTGRLAPATSLSGAGVGDGLDTGTLTPTASLTGASSGQVTDSGVFTAQISISGVSPFARGLFTPSSAFTGQVTDAVATPDNLLGREWQLTVDGDIEQNLYDVEVVDTASTFGDYAVCKIDDTEGTKFDDFARGTRIELAVSQTGGISFENRFTGYVVERREIEDSGADALEIEAYTFDQFLRRNKVSTDLTGLSIQDALESIITNDTPIDFVAANVTVGDEQELTRAYRGDPVEEALRDLSFKSENEEFGVNDDLEFFFRPRETEHIDRGIDNTQWRNYDIPELGKEVINEVEVWFDDGDESVIVDDGGDKLDLQESLGLSDPGTQRAEINRPKLTDISDAEDEGRKYLQFRNATLSGTVTTFDLYNAQPGDTIDVTIPPRGIDTEFRIAEVEYRWGTDETILTIVEKRGNNDDVIFRLSEDVERLELQDANRDAPKNRITTTKTTAIVAPTTEDSAAGEIQRDRFTNNGRNLLRDVWTGEPTEPITTLVVGDDPSGLSRSNSSLRNQIDSVSVTQSLVGGTGVAFTASVNQEIFELGLETASGRLVHRAVIEDGLDAEDITVTLDVANDASVSRGVVTATGQEAIRDILADNNPLVPTEYAYGTGDGSVSESDTSLVSEVVRQDLEKVLIEELTSTSDFESATDFDDESRIVIENDTIRVAQSGFFIEAEDADTQNSDVVANSNFSNQEGVRSGGSPNADTLIREPFTPEYTIPAINIGGTMIIAGRVEVANDNDHPAYEYFLEKDGERIDTAPIQEDSKLAGVDWDVEQLATDAEIDEIVKGGDYAFGVEIFSTESTSTEIEVDCLHIGDNNFDYTYDNTLGEFNELSGPELFPAVESVSLAGVGTRRDATQAVVDLDINETDNGQFIEISNDGSTFTRFNNTDSATDTFSATREIFVNLGLDGSTPATRTSSPSERYEPQTVSISSLSANPDAVTAEGIGETTTRAVIQPNTITGETLQEAGIFDGSDLLTRAVFAPFEVLTDQRIASDDTTRFEQQ